MSLIHANARTLLTTALVLAMATTSGCGWFRSKTGYEHSPESRPLEVPPDLTVPRTDPTMQVPQVASAPQPAAAPGGVQAVSGFAVSDSVESVWRRIGLALERIDGVAITNRAQLIGSYEVQYQGQSFLLRAQAEGEATRVVAVGADGQPLVSGPAAQLLGLLRQRIG